MPKAPRLNSLFKPCAGQSVWRNLIRRHCRLHNDIARILLAGDGQFGELPQSLPKNTCFGKRMEEQEVRFDEKLSRSIRESENLVLEAGERNRAILEQKIDDLRVDVSELQQYYRANRMQQDTTELLRKQVKGLEERVEILEARIG